MRLRLKSFGQWWVNLRKSSEFRNLLTYAVFVAIAALFWVIITLNDSVQHGTMVNVKITNKPDSVTFISEVPKTIHVEIKDKGSGLMRSAYFRTPTVNLNFRDLAAEGQFICSHSDLRAALKETFGINASILSCSIDSLRLTYTDRPGKNVPVQVSVVARPRAGYIVYGNPSSEPLRVTAYGPREILDTLHRVFTKTYVESDLAESVTFVSELKPIKGVRLIPSSVKVKINVEPLVAKEELVSVMAENVPQDESLLLFPSKVRVSYYVPMSEFSIEKKRVRVVTDYNEVASHRGERLPLKIELIDAVNTILPTLHSDSVEYTLVR